MDSVIDVQQLEYRYPGATTAAVRGVSFAVRPGEVFGLLGPSGAGKSTLQKVLTRQHRRIAGGSVTVLGKPIGAWGQDFYERIGVGFELPNHFPRLTAGENLDFFASLYTRPTRGPRELLELVGLERHLGTRVSEFSKGMMMRLNFVRAIMHDPELLFLDEPTSGLDPVNAAHVKALVRALQREGKTVVLTTHNMTDVDELCERVGFMVAGEMKTLDDKQALKARYGRRELVVEHGAGAAPRRSTFPLEGLHADAGFQALLKEGQLRTLHSQEATLDRVFAAVTGTALTGGEVTS
ncbi:MAG: ABC transporter ATP-binding protein [Myxococcaceae bacterium]|nr:ABC transporter ATP-binding protein [Myxococcaceae bacterium]